jgi:SPP1 gp7 family putative phage head morphogenesis protein
MAKPKTAAPVFPNAGVTAWYQTQLVKVLEAARDGVMLVLRAVYKEAPSTFAADSTRTWAAGVMFRLPDGRVLLGSRTDGQGWAWPAGGIEPGEDPEGAARREAGEEIGWGGQHPLQLLEVREARGVRFFTYTCDVPAPFVMVLNGEHREMRWTTPDYALRCLHMHPGARATLAAQHPVEWIATEDAAPIGPELLRRALEKWGAIWRGRLDDLSLDLSTKFADKTFNATQAQLRASFKAAGLTVAFKPTAASRAAYQAVVAENVNLIRSIPEQYLKDVQTQVWQSVMKGSDLGTLSRQLQKDYDVGHRRAALIARDQNAKAKAVIENTRRKELGITEAIWMHSTAGKEPRPTHVAMDGKRYKLDRGMWDKDKRVQAYIYPGELINCRCVSRAVLPGFE